MTTVTKPQLRNLGVTAWSKCIAFSLIVSGAWALYYKKYILEARKKQYADFYENYDADKEYEAIKKAGLFKGFEDPR